MSNDRHKYRIPFFDNSGKFIGFEDLDILKGVQPYNAGVCHRGEPEQCLGLTDKNGKPVYEGDVLEKIAEASCYNTNNHTGFRIYKKRKEKGLIVEETKNIKFNEIIYCFRTGKTDIATMDRFPCYWLKKEEFGWEGEELESPEDWIIIGNIHDDQFRKVTKMVEEI